MFDANTVLNQLTQSNSGVGVLRSMIGAKNFFKDDKKSMVGFSFMRGAKNKANTIRITLNAMDTYDVEFIRIWGTSIKVVGSHEGIYYDMLKSIFESETQLYLKL